MAEPLKTAKGRILLAALLATIVALCIYGRYLLSN